MLMRFHWGLGVGHTYAHSSPCQNSSVYKKWPKNPPSPCENQDDSSHEEEPNAGDNLEDIINEEAGSASEGEDNGQEEWRSVYSRDSGEENGEDDENEEELLYYDMYGFVDSDGDED